MKISVCMCTYNGEKYIEEQLDSIISQTICPNEIIIYDDCSKDNTVALIRKYICKNPSIDWKLFVNEKNEGWKVNFHSAINASTGEYIFLADQDDIWEITKIEKMFNIMKSNLNIDVLTCNQMIWYQENKKIEKNFKNDYSLEKIVDSKYLLYTGRPGCVFCIRKKFIEDFNTFWNPNFPHDSLLWKLAYLKGSLYNANFYGIKWRRHGNNATGKTKKIISYENVVIHYKVILLYIEIVNTIKVYDKINDINKTRLNKVIDMLEIRKNLYEKRKLTYFFKLFKYIRFYASKKAYLMDGVVFFMKNESERRK